MDIVMLACIITLVTHGINAPFFIFEFDAFTMCLYTLQFKW